MSIGTKARISDDRRLQAVDGDDHEPEGGGEAVGRRGRGHPDHVEEISPSAPPFSPFSPTDLAGPLGRRGAAMISHGDPFGRRWPAPYPNGVDCSVHFPTQSADLGRSDLDRPRFRRRAGAPISDQGVSSSRRRRGRCCCRSCSRLAARSRETCIWLTPTDTAISDWVSPSHEAHAQDRLLTRGQAWPGRGQQRPLLHRLVAGRRVRPAGPRAGRPHSRTRQWTWPGNPAQLRSLR